MLLIKGVPAGRLEHLRGGSLLIVARLITTMHRHRCPPSSIIVQKAMLSGFQIFMRSEKHWIAIGGQRAWYGYEQTIAG
jgi:hypothetical protein